MGAKVTQIVKQASASIDGTLCSIFIWRPVAVPPSLLPTTLPMKVQSNLLTLAAVATDPGCVTRLLLLPTGESLHFRPLLPDDAALLAAFLQSLSPQTRRFSTYDGYDLVSAQALCTAINRYDKLRLVAVVNQQIVALFEFSFALVAADQTRYASYGLPLDEQTDCRFGLCIADDYQDRGLGTQLLPLVLDIARRFGKERMILWGGVLADNQRAIRYYEKNGFRLLGHFQDAQGVTARDGILVL